MKPAEVYILETPEPFRAILLHLQLVIEHTLPEAELKYKWKVPFFYIGKRPICFLNHTKDYVDVGFWHAAHLTLFTEHLISDGRKVMKSLRYKSLDQVDDHVLQAIIKEAASYRDKGFWKRD